MTHAILTAGGSTPTLGRSQRAPRTAKKISFASNTTRSQVSAGEGAQPPASVRALLSKITESCEALDLSELVRETSDYQRKL
jgi:hypothetical protein